MKKINDWLGLHITKAIGTMWCAYAFAVLALISLPGALKSHNAVVIIAWIAQTFIQLVLLPIIIVGQNLQQQSHNKLQKDVKKIHKHLKIK